MKGTLSNNRYLILLVLLLTVFNGFSQSKVKTNTNAKAKTGKVYTIEIIKMKFVPAEITVQKGDKVVWVNKDFYPHDVTDELKMAWSSKPLNQNQSWGKVITKNENYFCNLHRVMKGRIIVK